MSEQMQPGPELDAAVAAALRKLPDPPDGIEYGFAPQPSHSLSDAGRVVEQLRQQGWRFVIELMKEDICWVLAMHSDDMDEWRVGEAAKLPHAICLAVLTALEGK